MTPQEFQIKHGFSDEDMQRIKDLCIIFNGKIASIGDKK